MDYGRTDTDRIESVETNGENKMVEWVSSNTSKEWQNTFTYNLKGQGKLCGQYTLKEEKEYSNSTTQLKSIKFWDTKKQKCRNRGLLNYVFKKS